MNKTDQLLINPESLGTMRGKTHLVTGTALAVLILQTESLPHLVGGLAVAAFGSVISDVDSGNSKAGHRSSKVIAFLIILACLVLLADHLFSLSLYDTLIRQAAGSRILTDCLALLILVCLGILSGHRTFMHSLTAMILMGLCVYDLSPALFPWFMISFGTHLLLDLLNKKGEMLFFPFRRRFSLGWFKTEGLFDRLLFGLCLVILIIRVWQVTTV